MALNVGSRIAHYDVTALIGEGGMGQVYQATDTKLNRQVALKILPEAFATDPDRLARFQREAQVLASLNHPGIAAIYGIEEQDGTRALVLELVEGPTLADRIAKGPIPLDEALPIAKQIAEALEAAHEAGVIHRDLKPANIKVREDGTVKVLDFGLAKALDTTPTGDPSQSPTLTAAATQMGVIMGTAAYMSPEQARGKVVDKRADIWAFGAVLYEMLTGTKPFPGDDISQTLARVIDRDPDWDALPESLPPALDTYLRRCLQREPRERVRDIGDVRLALVGAFETTVRSPSDALAGRPLHLWQRPLPLAVGVVALVVASLLGRNLLSDTPSTAPEPVRLSVVLPQGLQYSTASSPGHGLAISPDGRQLVFQGARDGQRSLFRRSLDSRSVEPIPGLEANILVRNLFFSPDGTSVAFVDGGGDLKKLSLGGALPTTLVRDVGPASGIWRNDDEIVYTATGEGLFQVSADGGTPTRLLEGTPGDRSNDIAIVPNTGDILFTRASSGESRIELLNADTGEVVPVADDASLVALTMSGHLLFERDDVIMAAAFDATEHRLGPVVPVLDGYARDGGQDTPQVAVSASGTLAYVAAAESSDNPTLDWVALDGTSTRLGELPVGSSMVDLSPDGTLAVVGTFDDVGPRVFVWDMVRQVPTGREVEGMMPRWHPDGRHVAFSRGAQLLLVDVDDWSETVLAESESDDVRSPSFSAEGDTVVFASGYNILALLPGDTTPQAIIATDAPEHSPALSPDGRWLAYVSQESGESHVYVVRFPSGTGRRRVTTNPGREPLWRQDGRALFFRERIGENEGGSCGLLLLARVRRSISVHPSHSSSSRTRLHPASPAHSAMWARRIRRVQTAHDS